MHHRLATRYPSQNLRGAHGYNLRIRYHAEELKYYFGGFGHEYKSLVQAKGHITLILRREGSPWSQCMRRQQTRFSYANRNRTMFTQSKG